MKNNHFKISSLELALLFLILLLAFFMAYIPHLNYPYPIHHDEWMRLAYSNAIMETGRISFKEPFYGLWDINLGSNPETGFDIFSAVLREITGISLIDLCKYLPGIIFMMTVLSVYVLAKRIGFGLEAAFITCLIPSSVGILGPSFFVPSSLAMMFLPITFFLAFYLKIWQSYLLLFIITCFLFLTHPPTATITLIALVPFIILNLKGNFKHSIGLILAMGIPFAIIIFLIFEQQLPPIEQLLTTQTQSYPITLPPLLQTYGYLPLIVIFIGATFLAFKGGKDNYGLLFGTLGLLLVLTLYVRFRLGLSILYERGLTLLLLLLSIIGGAGLYWIRTTDFSKSLKVNRKSLFFRNFNYFLCFTLVIAMLFVSVITHLNTRYYHMIDEEDYQSFLWIKENLGDDYKIAMLDPWKATPFVAITQKNVIRRIFLETEPVDNKIYKFLKSGCKDTAFLRNNNISIFYNRWKCNSPDLYKIRNNVFLIKNLAYIEKLKNNGFEAIWGDTPAWWYTWSENCEPIFVYPEPGLDNNSCVSIQLTGALVQKRWYSAIWFQDIYVTEGKTYRISGWIKTNNVVGNGGAMIIPHWKTEQNEWKGETRFMDYIKGTHDWNYYEGEVIVPHGINKCTLCLLLADCTGKVYFDNISCYESNEK